MRNRRTIGWILTGFVTLFLLADASVSIFAPQLLAADLAATGFTSTALPIIGLAAASGAILFAIPQTGAIGAILITGFFGGAICTHVRIGELGSPPQMLCLVVGCLAWTALILREPRIDALLVRA